MNINILDGIEDLVDEVEVNIKINKGKPVIVVDKKYNKKTQNIRLI